ncbi:hypothetical protein [Flavihumibacter petaseus]|uniref:Uncharacterized protein n=1 Tax=Flavihumibacter petaseus NBRC 106054 TaxID=1220578 RepID=A0A0E9MZU4_9BACT|nr:hypothetical protein [Flavihumibacter petaseus]GAO43058.1 hypothetical protein FPE01S_02_01630 [Flavihumibacter petaseus NBRC 106054]
MNDIFSAQRFWWLMRKVMVERTSQILGSMVLCLVVTFIVYALTQLLQGVEVGQNAGFEVGLVLGGPLVASIVFGYFNTSASGASFLMLPASAFEKWLSGILIVGVLYFGIFLAFFRLIDMAFVANYYRGFDKALPHVKERMEAVRELAYNGVVGRGTFLMYFNFTGMLMLGALYFNKAAFVKTALIICSLIVCSFVLNYVVVSALIKDTQVAFPFNIVWVWVGNQRAPVVLPENISEKITFIFRYVLPVMLWSLTLLRLKEKEF